MCLLLLRIELQDQGRGDHRGRLREVAAASGKGNEVAETVRIYEKVIEMAARGENGGWDELISEELNKPSIQL